MANIGLAARWRIDEGTGQALRDSSGHGLHGVLGLVSSSDVNDPTWIAGRRGAALRFGGDDLVEIRYLEPKQITVEAWIRASANPGAFKYVVSKGADGDHGAASYGLYTGPSSGLMFYVADGASHFSSSDAGPRVWDGEWHHAAGTYGNGSLRFFLDGSEVGVPTAGPASIEYGKPDDTRFYIGQYRGQSPASFGFIGDIDEVAVWSRALKPGEVAMRATGRDLP